MKRTHPAFWGAGWAGIVTGAALMIYGIAGPVDIGGLIGTYGLLLMGAAAYLLIGLKLRERVAHRGTAVATRSVTVPAAGRS